LLEANQTEMERSDTVKYDARAIEAKWQRVWADARAFETSLGTILGRVDGAVVRARGIPYARAGRFELPAEYVDAVRRAGGIPVLLPPGEPDAFAVCDRLDGFVLSGGGDVDPMHYGGDAGHPEIDRVDAERDGTELAYARRIAADGVPALCICRGAQVLNVALGGSLIEHLPDEVGEDVEHRRTPQDPPRHAVEVAAGSLLATVLGNTRPVPVSRHHQAARAVAPGLRAVAWAADGTIEALEASAGDAHPAHCRQPWLIAVQWHPESSAAEDPSQQRLFDALVSAAAERRATRAP